jgi:hypothetical protein
MNHMRTIALSALAISGLAGCQAMETNTEPELEPESVESASEALFETSCTTTSVLSYVAPTGTAPAACGTFQEFSAQSKSIPYPANASCPEQFVVEVGRANGSPIGSGYYYVGDESVGGIVTDSANQTDCQNQNATYAVWSYSGGTWTSVAQTWLKGSWDSSALPYGFPCSWTNYASSGSLATVPSGAAKLRIATSRWVESGTKGADSSDTYRPVKAGIGAGHFCPPG